MDIIEKCRSLLMEYEGIILLIYLVPMLKGR